MNIKWISIKERLPDRQPVGFRTYIVASRHISTNRKHVGTYDWRNNYFQDSFGDKILFDDGYWEITHWCELPEPPEDL